MYAARPTNNDAASTEVRRNIQRRRRRGFGSCGAVVLISDWARAHDWGVEPIESDTGETGDAPIEVDEDVPILNLFPNSTACVTNPRFPDAASRSRELPPLYARAWGSFRSPFRPQATRPRHLFTL